MVDRYSVRIVVGISHWRRSIVDNNAGLRLLLLYQIINAFAGSRLFEPETSACGLLAVRRVWLRFRINRSLLSALCSLFSAVREAQIPSL